MSEHFRWQDALDIAILTFVLCRMYLWLRGTVALQVALGMLTLAAASFGASKAGLVLTAYVLQAVGAVSVLVAVVIFRDEIRRALGRASPLRWLRERRGMGSQVAPGIYAPLAEALSTLAAKRTGALIVIPRRDRVEEHLTSGVRLEALTSPQIFEAIFQPGSPVHDGAVVVTGDRIRLAGAVLPLTARTDLPEHYGTRHRAAVGLSEVSDAITLVVSEERGQVSLASAGRIAAAPATPAALERQIVELLREVPAARVSTSMVMKRQRLRRQALRDGLVFFAILGGVTAAWHTVAGERGSIIVRTVPVELRGAPELQFEPPRPDQVALHLRGPRRLLMELGPADLHTSIDLTDARPGTHELHVTASAPPGVEIVRITPAVVKVKVR